MRVAVVIPTYNERNNINNVVASVKDNLSTRNTVVSFVIVDDNSQDGTADVVRALARKNDLIGNMHLISRPKKMGLGSAYVDAFKWILNNRQTDVIVQMDADLSHPPQLLLDLITPIIVDSVDVVVASRYCGDGSSNHWPIYRKVISKGANTLAKLFLGIKIQDITSGYRAFRTSAVKDLLTNDLSSNGYEFQVETIYLLSKMGRKIKEIPFVFNDRIDGKSKLTFKDVLAFANLVISLRFKSLTQMEPHSERLRANIQKKAQGH